MRIYSYKGAQALLFTLLLLLQFYFLSVYMNVIQISEWMQLYWPMFLTTIATIALLTIDKNVLPLGANMMVLMYSICSMLALLLLLPIFPEIGDIRSKTTMSFLDDQELIPSICIASIGIIVFTLATSMFSRRVSDKKISRTPVFGKGTTDLATDDSVSRLMISDLSIVLLLGCFLYFLLLVATHPVYLSGSYVERSDATSSNSLFTFTTIVMGLSFAMLMTVASGKKLKIGVLVFIGLAAINFLMGNRGEIYYPALAGVAIYTKRGGTFKKRYAFIGLVGSLFLISVIRGIRSVGISSGNIGTILANFSPLPAIAETFGEMGFQIGTISYTLSYLDSGGSLLFGATYVYAFQKFLVKYLPFIPAVDTNSPAIIKKMLPSSYFAYSNIGEAYYNFGMIGVYVFCILLAWYLVKHSKYQNKLFTELFFNMFLVEIILLVRNSTSTLPTYLAWIVVLLILAKLYVALLKRRYIRYIC